MNLTEIHEIPVLTPAPDAAHRFIKNRQRAGQRPHRWTVSAVAAAVSLSAHLLLMGSLVWQEPTHRLRRDPNSEGAGASAGENSTSPIVSMVLIQLPSPANDTDADLALPSNGLLQNPTLQILSADARPAVQLLPPTNDPDAPIAEATGDEAQRALLFGRYMGQVKARIDRAWSRPRTPIEAPEFTCQVQIDQTPSGDVKTVELIRCNGDARWQTSLVAAINTASPLPAPPDPAVFAARLSLTFQGDAYRAGMLDYGYEPARSERVASAR